MGEPMKPSRSNSMKNLIRSLKAPVEIVERPSSSENKSAESGKVVNCKHRRSLSQGCIVKPDSTAAANHQAASKPSQEKYDDHFIAYMNYIHTKKIRQDIEKEQKEIDEKEKELKRYRDKNDVLKKILPIKQFLNNFIFQKLDTEKIDEVLSFVNNLKIECTEKNLKLSAGVEEQLCKLSQVCVEMKEYFKAAAQMEENKVKLQEKLQHYIQLRTMLDQVLKDAGVFVMQQLLINENEKNNKSL